MSDSKVKKSKSPSKSSAADELKTVRDAHKAALKELDRAKKEIGDLRKELRDREKEIADLRKQVTENKQNKHNKHVEITEMLNTINIGNEDILQGILSRLASIEKKIGSIPVPPSPEPKRESMNIDGWTIQKDKKGFHRAFRNIGGKVRGVYLGKDISDENRIKQKLTSKYQEYSGQNKQKINKERQVVPDEKTQAAGESPDFPTRLKNVLLDTVRAHMGKSGIIPVWKARACLPLNYRPVFEKILISVLKTGEIELVGGNPADMTEDQLKDSITLDGTLYLNIQYHGA